ncbi:hypothetical protein PAMP_005519 [Pampus punctatissimus]
MPLSRATERGHQAPGLRGKLRTLISAVIGGRADRGAGGYEVPVLTASYYSSSSSPPLPYCAHLFTSPQLLYRLVVRLLEQKVKHGRLIELLETGEFDQIQQLSAFM